MGKLLELVEVYTLYDSYEAVEGKQLKLVVASKLKLLELVKSA